MIRSGARILLAVVLLVAGAAHLSALRRGFRIVVPEWAARLLHTDKDTIVVVSGVVEIMLGAGLVLLPRERRRVGAAVAAFLVAVFPGNVHQWRRGLIPLDHGPAHVAARQIHSGETDRNGISHACARLIACHGECECDRVR